MKTGIGRMIGATLIAAALCVHALAPTCAWGQTATSERADDWLEHVSARHPRMYMTRATWPAVRTYTLAHEKDYYERQVKRPADAAPLEPDRAAMERGSNKGYGPTALRCAFVWLMEGDRTALAKAKNYMLEGVRFYNRCSSARKPVNWYSCSRVQALTAYDWIYDQLTPAERKEFAEGFFKHYRDCLAGRSFPGQNRSDYKTGFYGPTNMAWYVGLAFHKDGIDDAEAERLLKKGYDEHIQLLKYRAASAGDDGGTGSVAVGYGLGMYPWAEFNFMHTYDSATGLAMERSYDHLSLFPNWVLWNVMPGRTLYGLADSVPAGRLRAHFLEMHMLQIAHFYARRFPERAQLATWVRNEMLESQQHDEYWWPLAPLLVPNCATLPAPKGPDGTWPRARNFEEMGVVFMNSGRGENDVYAAFVAGGSIQQHRHYDQGHFTIFRKGAYLALDSGDYGPRERNDHLTEYLYRTVAHNSILIHAPADADRPARIWGGPARTLDGGQCAFGGVQLAFETNDVYTYVATDMTKCYDPRKCARAVREFVFLYPDTFVIYDAVRTTEPEYRKQWLLHGVNKPEVNGRSFRFVHGDSALVGTCLYPDDAQIEAVGGPGKESWSAGANHPQEGEHRELAGAWRVEVTPGHTWKEDRFVHVLRVGDKTFKPDTIATPMMYSGLPLMGCRVPVAGGATADVLFNFNSRSNRDSIAASHILIGGRRLNLATKVQPQAGVPGEVH